MTLPSYRALIRKERRRRLRNGWLRVLYPATTLAAALLGAIVVGSSSTGTAGQAAAAGVAAAIGAALVVTVIVFVVVELRARSAASDIYLAAWGKERGWEYDPAPPVWADTPLLRAGDETFARRAFLAAFGGVAGAIYEHTRRDVSSDGRGNTTTHDTHYLVLRLGLTLPGIGRLQLHPRGFGDNRLLDALDTKLTGNRVVELESEEFHDRYKLEVDDHCDEVVVRELFTPKAIVRLLEAERQGTLHDGLLLEAEGAAVVFACHNARVEPDKLDLLDDFVARTAPFVTWLADHAGVPA